MVRISDIFKRGRPETKPEEAPKILSSSPDIQPPGGIPQKEQTAIEGSDQMRIAKVMKETPVDKVRSRNLYLTGIQLIKEVLTSAEQLKPINLAQIEQWVGDIVEYLIFGNVELLSLFYEYESDNYMHSHMVNTTIMSIEVGLGMGYNKSQLNELGLASFLHDIGMIKAGKLEMEARKLSEEEYSQIKNHPLYGAEILSKIKDISEPVIYVAKEEHERMNGAGYPNNLKDGEISEYARIVAIVDVYEALTHNRPHRKKSSPHDTVKELIANNPLFDSNILKVMINKVGLYPTSSWVELNSNEIGKVMINNNEFPLRPVVHILFDAAGQALKEPRIINLAKQFNLFIKKPLSDEELAKKHKDPIES